METKDDEVCEEVSLELFRECSFEFERWVDACLQRQNFEEMRLNLERLYRETKNATMTLARDSVDDFGFGPDGRHSESGDGLLSELILRDMESQNQKIKVIHFSLRMQSSFSTLGWTDFPLSLRISTLISYKGYIFQIFTLKYSNTTISVQFHIFVL